MKRFLLLHSLLLLAFFIACFTPLSLSEQQGSLGAHKPSIESREVRFQDHDHEDEHDDHDHHEDEHDDHDDHDEHDEHDDHDDDHDADVNPRWLRGERRGLQRSARTSRLDRTYLVN